MRNCRRFLVYLFDFHLPTRHENVKTRKHFLFTILITEIANGLKACPSENIFYEMFSQKRLPNCCPNQSLKQDSFSLVMKKTAGCIIECSEWLWETRLNFNINKISSLNYNTKLCKVVLSFSAHVQYFL